MTSQIRRSDGWLLAAIFVLIGISILMVFSSTAVVSQELYGSSTTIIKRHLLHILIGLAAFLIFSRLSPYTLYRLAPVFLLLALGMLILVLIPQVGHSAGGARRWLVLGSWTMQPGEICKILVVLYMASYIERHKDRMTRFVPGILIPFTMLALFGALLLLQPDFGSTVVLAIVVLGQLLMASRIGHLAIAASGAAGLCIILVLTSPYRLRRFIAFLDPFNDPESSGYQLIQSLIAVGSGGLLGAGLGGGKQKLFYLPAAHTDFIYAVIAEELGLLGALAVLFLFVIILYRGLLIAKKFAENGFLCSLALGCTLLVVVPALLNMGVVCGLLPTKGLVLPLIAYGGTAMVVHLAAMGILIRLSAVEPRT